MFYNYYRDESSEYDECTARGVCSIAPKISSLQEVLLIFLRQLSYYALKLADIGEDISAVSANIVESLSNLVSTTDYTDEQLLGLVSKQYAYLIKTKRQYIKVCKEKEIPYSELKFALDINPQITLSSVISQGERIFLDKYNKMSVSERNMYEILLTVLKSVSSNIVQLRDFSVSDSGSEIEVLRGLDLLNSRRFSLSKVKKGIRILAETDSRVIRQTAKAQRENFGNVSETEVSHSTSKGKSILVSGGSLDELYSLLKDTSNNNIDIYTHGDLLIAHAFDEFKKFNNLKGHYGTCSENCILDFATFPGAILLTRNSSQNLEYLYRGRLFSTEIFKPKGVIQIVNKDFKQLIESAREAKGFAKGQIRESELVGYNSEELKSKLEDISTKFKNREIEKLVIVGISNYSKQQEFYFKNLFKHLPEKTYVISFSYQFDFLNVLKINLVNNMPLVYEVMEKLFEKIEINSDRISFFLTKCDTGSISKIISLKNNGAKKVFLFQCTPNLINPSVLSTLEKTYGIKSTSTPEKDAKLI